MQQQDLDAIVFREMKAEQVEAETNEAPGVADVDDSAAAAAEPLADDTPSQVDDHELQHGKRKAA